MKIIVNGIKIKTNSYAGNFEREMTAYCTGHIGECEVGMKEKLLYNKECGKEIEGVQRIPDENGCFRPVVLADDYNNLIIIFEEDFKIEEKISKIIEKRACEYAKNKDIQILGFEYGEFKFNI